MSGATAPNLRRYNASIGSKVSRTQVKTGDRFVYVGPADGGYGHPYDREPERVLDGFIIVETARHDFGVVLTPALTIDTDATAVARAAHPVYRPSARS